MPLSQASGMLDAWDGDSIVLDGDAGCSLNCSCVFPLVCQCKVAWLPVLYPYMIYVYIRLYKYQYTYNILNALQLRSKHWVIFSCRSLCGGVQPTSTGRVFVSMIWQSGKLHIGRARIAPGFSSHLRGAGSNGGVSVENLDSDDFGRSGHGLVNHHSSYGMARLAFSLVLETLWLNLRENRICMWGLSKNGGYSEMIILIGKLEIDQWIQRHAIFQTNPCIGHTTAHFWQHVTKANESQG